MLTPENKAYIILFAVLAVLIIIELLGCIVNTARYKEEFRYIKMELSRCEEYERRFWRKERRRMIFKVLNPFLDL